MFHTDIEKKHLRKMKAFWVLPASCANVLRSVVTQLSCGCFDDARGAPFSRAAGLELRAEQRNGTLGCRIELNQPGASACRRVGPSCLVEDARRTVRAVYMFLKPRSLKF